MARLGQDRVLTTSHRFSLRVRVFLAILGTALVPQLLVFAWSMFERDAKNKMRGHTWDTANAARRVVIAGGSPENELGKLAIARGVHLRMLDDEGRTVFDVDADHPDDASEPLQRFFFDAQDQSAVREVDRDLGPVQDRSEVAYARSSGSFMDCQTSNVMVCQGVLPVKEAHTLIHVQKTSLRPVQAVYALRHQLVRLGFFTVPLAFLLALYLVSRIMRPIESLRRQALAKAGLASRSADLEEHQDEVGDVGHAVNILLASLEERRAANEAFVADLVHELKTPVAAIRATGDVLSDSAKKLDGLVTEFLDLARAEAGMPNEERSSVDVRALCEGVVESAKSDTRHAALTFEFSGSPEPLLITGVAHRLESTVRELLENAASFAKSTVHISLTVSARDVVLSVHDDGAGIAHGDLPKVFDRFFTTRSRARGTGLGLALVRAVAEAHGGSVAVESEPEQGTTFELSLPRVHTEFTPVSGTVHRG
jgi:signal transduction histidine kinase